MPRQSRRTLRDASVACVHFGSLTTIKQHDFQLFELPFGESEICSNDTPMRTTSHPGTVGRVDI